MGVGTIVVGILIAFFILVIIGIVIFMALVEVNKDYKKMHTINIDDIPKDKLRAENSYYRNQGCVSYHGYDYHKWDCSNPIKPFDYKEGE